MLVGTYSELRSQIKSGDLAFFYSKLRWHHKLIKWLTGSSMVHVGMVFWATIENESHLLIIEANGGTQRRIVNLSHYKNYTIDIVSTHKDWDDVFEIALKRLGEVEYGWLEATYVGIREWIFRKFNRVVPNVNFDGEICSQFISNILDMGYDHQSPYQLYRRGIAFYNWKVRFRIIKKPR